MKRRRKKLNARAQTFKCCYIYVKHLNKLREHTHTHTHKCGARVETTRQEKTDGETEKTDGILEHVHYFRQIFIIGTNQCFRDGMFKRRGRARDHIHEIL